MHELIKSMLVVDHSMIKVPEGMILQRALEQLPRMRPSDSDPVIRHKGEDVAHVFTVRIGGVELELLCGLNRAGYLADQHIFEDVRAARITQCVPLASLEGRTIGKVKLDVPRVDQSGSSEPESRSNEHLRALELVALVQSIKKSFSDDRATLVKLVDAVLEIYKQGDNK